MKKLKKGRVVLALFILIVILSGSLLLFKEIFTGNIDSPIKMSKNGESYETLSMLVAGNVLIDRNIYRDAIVELNEYDFNYIFEDFKEKLENFDLKMYNQTSIIGGKALGLSTSPRYNSPEEIGDAMLNLGFNVVSLANFNSFDRGEIGIINSVDYWSEKDVLYSGTYKTEDQNLLTKEKDDLKYTMLSYTTKTNFSLTKNHLVNIYSEDKIKEDLEKIKDKTDLIIVSIFWEENIVEQRKISEYLASLGVDIIIGNNNKTIQPIDIIDDTLVIYSTGNLLSYESNVDNSTGMVVSFDINIKEDQKTFENINSELIYVFNDNGNNFKVISYDDLTEEQLPNKKALYEKFSENIRSLYKTITISKLGE